MTTISTKENPSLLRRIFSDNGKLFSHSMSISMWSVTYVTGLSSTKI
jgi:hypothetical protein